MRSLVFLAFLTAAGCGQQIGDACIVSSDCAIDGSRSCDISMREGYCTILGCDSNTCPGEAACIRFFSGGFTNRSCDTTTEDRPGGTNDCSLDELCSLEGECVPRSAESRFCMKSCETSKDCRDGYECRDLTLMTSHGGEPVLGPYVPPSDQPARVETSSEYEKRLQDAPRFCAMAPAT
ncbi:MAG: hypothetical protein ABI591_06675 [Kofleriaceae bacterium]